MQWPAHDAYHGVAGPEKEGVGEEADEAHDPHKRLDNVLALEEPPRRFRVHERGQRQAVHAEETLGLPADLRGLA